MSATSTNLNGKAVAGHTYDAIVIGSGISGGWAAKELTERGLKTIMLERGRNFEHIKDYKTATNNPWDFEHRGAVPLQKKKRHPPARPNRNVRHPLPSGTGPCGDRVLIGNC